MAAATGQVKALAAKQQHGRRTKDAKDVSRVKSPAEEIQKQLAEEHLPPLFLVAVVLMCSGPLFVLAMRDFSSTGKIIAGAWDAALTVN
jgi:hypothetical protein